MIYVIFEDEIDLYFARSRVLERMSFVAKSLLAGGGTWMMSRAETAAADAAPAGTLIQRVEATDLQVHLLSQTGTLAQGRNAFTIEFRSASGALVDVGTLRATATMPMPGMLMSGGLQVAATEVPGRYEARAEFAMAGAWLMAIEWDGPGGRGAVNFEGTVQ